MIHSAGVLAGAYGGFTRKLTDQTTLLHAVSDEPISVGRLKRDAGEAFCNKQLSDATNLVDNGDWHDASLITCPKCCDIIKRIGAK